MDYNITTPCLPTNLTIEKCDPKRASSGLDTNIVVSRFPN